MSWSRRHLDSHDLPLYGQRMFSPFVWYGVLDRQTEDVILWHRTEDDALRDIAAMVRDEPGWDGMFEVVLVDFASAGILSEA